MDIHLSGIVVAFVLIFSSLRAASGSSQTSDGEREISEKLMLEDGNSIPLATGLLKLDPTSVSAHDLALRPKFPLILAAERTKRSDILNGLRKYGGGWNMTSKHYWASVGFSGVAAFILAFLWFISFGLVLVIHQCCGWAIRINLKSAYHPHRISLGLLLLFTCAATIGCILLSVGQDKFHCEMLNTLGYVVSQSNFIVEILRNVTDSLYLAKSIHVDEVFLPPKDKNEIDNLNVGLSDAASTITESTSRTSARITRALNSVRYGLISVASVMLLLSVIGFLFSITGHEHASYIFVLSGWLLVVVTFILCGLFTILNNAISDTRVAMKEWVDHPEAETALSSILPCVDERITNQTLYQSKEVIRQLVNVVNTAIDTVVNSNSSHHNESGPLMPHLCSPFDEQLNNHQCKPNEVSYLDASQVWQQYTCTISPSGLCTTEGRVTPDLYTQLMVAVNVSYALDHYTPFLLSLQDCNFVRDAFTTINTSYCPHLEQYLKLVCVGLALISVGFMFCLILLVFYANRPQREEAFVNNLSGVKLTGIRNK